jgi:cell division protein FtsW (lipid II flippase)
MNLEAWVLCALLGVQIVFQTKIATGAPYGRISYGGKYKGTLPKNYRIVSAVSVLVYLFFISVVLVYSSDLSTYSETFSKSVLWFMALFFGLGTVANIASRSKPERWWALYTVIALLFTLLVLDIL